MMLMMPSSRRGGTPFSSEKLDAGQRRSEDLISRWHGAEDGRVRCMESPHAPELCSPELLRESALMAERHDIGSTIHLSQSHKEVEGVMRTREEYARRSTCSPTGC